MPLTLERLVAGTRTFTWHFLGEDVEVTYRPGVLTYAWLFDGTPHDSLAAAAVSLDITGANGKPIKLDADSLRETLPVHVLRTINQAIWDDARVDPTTAETSGGS
jgi:hypothetical protein